jgi:hypothetical protein
MPNETRPYLVNNSTRHVHSTASKIPFCQPSPGDNVGYADEGALERLVMEQGLMPCAYCLRDEADELLKRIK